MTATAAVLAWAADIMDAAPCLWQSGRPGTSAGTCTWLSLVKAHEEHVGRRWSGGDRLEEGLAAVLGVEPTPHGVITWSDAPGRTKEEAVAALREAARRTR